jgi:succinate dehydrogenase/fumarate reductase flavoprotein subunit
MLLNRQEALSCDVLVIGGGGAGLRAAIAARSNKADVLLVSKTRVGRATNTYISKAVIASTGWGTGEDSQQAHLVDTVKGGRFLNDQAMVAQMAERAHSEIAFLKHCGVDFAMDKGRLRVQKTPGHRHPRHVRGMNWSGADLVLPLERRAKQLGVRFAGQVFVTRLLAAEDRVAGAAGITSDGRFLALHARAVVLATGGYAQIYANTNNAPGLTGDGQALAYHLGLPLKDMEFVQFYPTATGRHGSRLILYERLLTQPGVVLCNGRGGNILAHHGIDPAEVTRDRLARLIAGELGHTGTPGQEIFMDLRGLSEETADRLAPIVPPKWWQGQKAFRVTPTAHFCMGGIVTDQWGETPLAGLFAVGEAAAGVHGANRLGGNALAEIFTMGSLVGEKAADRTGNSGTVTVPQNAFQKERSRLAGFHSNEGVSAKQQIRELKRLMWEKAGVIRQRSGLEEALKRLGEPRPRVKVSTPAGLVRLLEFKNMRQVASMVCRSALERTESRGSHYRTDYPAEDNRRWLKNIVLRKGSTGMHVEAWPVTLDRVKVKCHGAYEI